MAAFTSPMFYVRRQKIVGNTTVPASDILKRLNLPRHSNIFLIRKRMIAERVMTNPVVKDVRLHRKLPDILIVQVIERKPYLTLSTSEKLYAVDHAGVPFRILKHADSELPVVSCKVKKRIVLGKPLNDPNFKIARDCLLLVNGRKIFQITELGVDQNQELWLNVRDGFQVKLGQAARLSEKLRIAKQAVDQIPEFKQRGKYIDVTIPEAPALKLED